MQKTKMPFKTLNLFMYSLVLVMISLAIGAGLGCSTEKPQVTEKKSNVDQINIETEKFWKEIDELLKTDEFGYRVQINTNSDFFAVLDEVKNTVNGLKNITDSLNETNSTLDWESLNFGLPNHYTRLNILIAQLELKYLEENMKLDPSESAKLKYDNLCKEFKDLIKTQTLVD